MKRTAHIYLAIGFLAWNGVACSESSFSGGSNKAAQTADDKKPGDDTGDTGEPGDPGDDPLPTNKQPTEPDGPGGDNPPGGTPGTDCVDGDKVKFAWTGDIKACIIDQGKTYNFDSKKCAEMRQASFDCTWDNLINAMHEINLEPTNKIKTDKAAGAKIVTCGQSKDGNRIVVQWIREPKGGFKCGADADANGMITTGCYTIYPDGNQPPDPVTDAEKKKQVYDCMNQL